MGWNNRYKSTKFGLTQSAKGLFFTKVYSLSFSYYIATLRENPGRKPLNFSGAHIRQIPWSTQRSERSGMRRSPKMCQGILEIFESWKANIQFSKRWGCKSHKKNYTRWAPDPVLELPNLKKMDRSKWVRISGQKSHKKNLFNHHLASSEMQFKYSRKVKNTAVTNTIWRRS